MAHRIIYIGDPQSLVGRAVGNKMEEAGIAVIVLPPVVGEVNRNRYAADVFLYQPEEGDPQEDRMLRFLDSFCGATRKSLCLVGAPGVLDAIQGSRYGKHVARAYPTPANMEAMAADMGELAKSQEAFRRPKAILLVEGDKDFRMALTYWLRYAYKVVGTGSGAKAVEYLFTPRLVRPDLILLDRHLPDMDGYEVMQRLQRDPLSSHIPVILLAGEDGMGDGMGAGQEGLAGSLPNSIKKTELLDFLGGFFAKRAGLAG